jgi:hypothetical protein
MDEPRCPRRKLYLPVGYNFQFKPDIRHTFHQFQKQGYEAKPVDLQVSFGKGDKVSNLRTKCRRADSQFWTNLFPTKLVDQHQKDIKRFATAIRWMRRLEVLFALIPIRISLKMWGLSEEFINYMVYPRFVCYITIEW